MVLCHSVMVLWRGPSVGGEQASPGPSEGGGVAAPSFPVGLDVLMPCRRHSRRGLGCLCLVVLCLVVLLRAAAPLPSEGRGRGWGPYLSLCKSPQRVGQQRKASLQKQI